jgi:hypothetical protein
MTNMSQIDQQRLHALKESVDAWAPSLPSIPKILEHWRGRPSANSQSRITIVAFAKWALSPAQRKDEVIEALRKEAQRLVDYDPEPTVDEERRSIYSHTARWLPTSYQLASAIAHTALAAVYNRKKETAAARTHIRHASTLYELAWPIARTRLPQSSIDVSASNAINPSSNLRQILSLLQPIDASDDVEQPTATTWLILYDLLMEILSGHLIANHSNPIKMLTIGQDSIDPLTETGHVVPATVRRIETPIPGFYPDPLSFGVTQLSESMRRSMLAAWRCCLSGDKDDMDVSRLTLRVDIDLQSMHVIELSGTSAGGLLAASMYATALGRTLSPACSATCSLRLDDNAKVQPETVALSYHDVWLGRISGVVAKAREAWIGHGVDEIFVCTEDWDEWDRANRQGPVATKVRTLAELVDGLDRDRSHLDYLKSISRYQHQRWGNIIADQGKPRTDRDHYHRLDLYVPPSLTVEGPRKSLDQLSELNQDQSPTEQRDCKEIQVPGEPLTDSILVNLLKLALQDDTELPSTDWDTAKAWLACGRDLLLYDTAGAGKSVCTLRMMHLLSDDAFRAELWHEPHSWLVVRFEGYWHREHSELSTIRDHVSHVISQQRERSGADDSMKLRQAIDFAFQRKRVVVIIDGFDQLKTEERAHVVAERDSDDGRRCRWIIASREHTIATLFDSDRSFRQWTKVRIDPFGRRHQDKYFKKAGLADRWQDYVDRDSMDELLQLPFVLDQLRMFIDSDQSESRSEKAVFESLSQLSLITARMLLDTRALPNDKRAGITPVAGLSRSEELETLEHVLSLIAFQMMLNGEVNARVSGPDNVASLFEACEARYFWDLDQEEHRLRDERATMRLMNKHEFKVQHRQACWDWALTTLRAIELNHREVLEHNDDDMIAFRSRKSMECYAARYITRFATRWDVFGDELSKGQPSDQSPCLWDHTVDEQWLETWKLAIEMPQTSLPGSWDSVVTDAVIDHQITVVSLSVLFRLPKQKDGQLERRPTELIWRCWPLFEYDEGRALDYRFREASRFVTGHDLVRRGQSERMKQMAQSNLLTERSQNTTVSQQREQILQKFRESSRKLDSEFAKRFDTVLQSDGSRVPIPASKRDRQRVLAQWQVQSSWEKSRTMIQCPPETWINECDFDPRVNDAIEGHETEAIRPIRIQATAVTRGMFRLFDEAITMIADIAESFVKADPADFPVVEVNWYDAWVFCKWMGAQYRLPTGFEWEHACRAGTKTEFHFGNELNGTLANCDGTRPYGTDANGNELKAGDSLAGCTPAGLGRYPCNAYGLFDVHGNVWEWCENWDGKLAAGRFLCGGCWIDIGRSCRSGSRQSFVPSRRSWSSGFRLAAVLEPSQAVKQAVD